MAEKVFTGGCLCGGVRFEARGLPDFPHTCSCRMCQRHSGALTTTWVEFAKADVAWTGAHGPPATYRSSEKSSRAFCRQCGATLGAIDDAPTIGLALGVFDKPSAASLKPLSHSYKSARPRWWKVAIDGVDA